MGMRLHAESGCMQANHVQLATDAIAYGAAEADPEPMPPRLIRDTLASACIPPAWATIRHSTSVAVYP